MLRLRIFTAVAILAVLLPAVFFPNPIAFACVAAVLVACGVWEWFRLNGAGRYHALIAGVLCAGVCLCLWRLELQGSTLRLVWLVCALAWVLGGGLLLSSGIGAWSAMSKPVRQWTGFALLSAAWLAVVFARTRGINFLFSVMALVWMADIAAYVAGRSFGGRFFSSRLAPAISPGKTREGAAGGLIGVLLLAFVWRYADAVMVVDSPSIYSLLAAKSMWFMVLAVLFLGVMSICGDLLESLVKRAAGAKDSSGLLPGHGGILDRVDALLPVVPLAMLMQAY